MEGIAIRYGDYAPEAKENFSPTATEKADFVDLTQLQQYNLDVANYANPCEYGAVLLDGSAVPFPNAPQDENMGYWSNSVSQSNKAFSAPIVITLTSEGQYSSQGFTFTFDTNNNIFCNDLNIHWYRTVEGVDTDLGDEDFTPDSAFYFCDNVVENFNKVVITFNSLNMPYNRLKIRSIDFGYGTIFTGNELSNVRVIQEIDRLSENISINVVDFDVKASNDFPYSFQKKQPISVYFNDNLLQTCFVDKSTRKGKREWSISTTDYIGLLDAVTFIGDVYTNKNAVELLTVIFTQTNTPYEIDSSFDSAVVAGHIPICTCREALKQICFAIGAIVDTSNSNVVKILPLSTAEPELIQLERILQGQNFADDSTVTSVEVTAHRFMQNGASITDLYKASESGAGTGILVKFSNPHYSLSITNGIIIQSSANYAIINANIDCVLTGRQYEDVQTVKKQTNPVVLSSEPENIVEFTDYTLVSAANVDDVLARCYNESIKTKTISLKIKEGKRKSKYSDGKYGELKYGQWLYDEPVELGKNYIFETEYLGNLEGRIISARYSLNGGIIIKECEAV